MNSTIKVLISICEKLGLKYRFIGQSGVFLQIKDSYFIHNNLGLNSGMVERICLDKGYTFELLNSLIKMPNTSLYIDPQAPGIFDQYATHATLEQIVDQIEKNHQYPVVVKAGRKSRGEQVFLCQNAKKLSKAIEAIFNQADRLYDHVLVVQDYIKVLKEFRVVVYDQKIQFVYQKDVADAKFVGNLSPLHWENAKAKLVKDKELITELERFIDPIYQNLDLKYGGLDVVESESHQLYLLEINTAPGFTYFVRDCGSKQLEPLFEKIILKSTL
jgi:glutathione synthase/RimK-type ligase-like ATP-grasp enzyme